MIEDLDLLVPEVLGDPGGVRAAANSVRGQASVLSSAADDAQRAADGCAASWSGAAAVAFVARSVQISGNVRRAAAQLESIASALTAYAAALEHATVQVAALKAQAQHTLDLIDRLRRQEGLLRAAGQGLTGPVVPAPGAAAAAEAERATRLRLTGHQITEALAELGRIARAAHQAHAVLGEARTALVGAIDGATPEDIVPGLAAWRDTGSVVMTAFTDTLGSVKGLVTAGQMGLAAHTLRVGAGELSGLRAAAQTAELAGEEFTHVRRLTVLAAREAQMQQLLSRGVDVVADGPFAKPPPGLGKVVGALPESVVAGSRVLGLTGTLLAAGSDALHGEEGHGQARDVATRVFGGAGAAGAGVLLVGVGGPVTVAAAGVAVAGYGVYKTGTFIYDNWDTISDTGRKVASAARDVGSAAMTKAGEAKDWAVRQSAKAVEQVKDKAAEVGEDIGEGVAQARDDVERRAADLAQRAQQGGSQVLTTVSEAVHRIPRPEISLPHLSLPDVQPSEVPVMIP